MDDTSPPSGMPVPTAPPARMYADRRVLKDSAATPPWEGRRASKIKERTAGSHPESVVGVNLIAPVQPSSGFVRPGDMPV